MQTITLPVKELKTALPGFSKIISKRSSLPVLSYLLIEREEMGQVTIAGTDLGSWATYSVDHEGTLCEPAKVLVPFSLLKEWMTLNKEDVVNIQFNDKTTSISYLIGDLPVSVKVDFLPIEDFPSAPEIKGKADPLAPIAKEMILRALQCCSQDANRFVLQGAYLDVSKENNHCIVGTDGRQIFCGNSVTLPIKDSIILGDHPFLSWPGFAKDGDWTLRGDKEQFTLASPHWQITGKGIDGSYPNWWQVVPENSATCTLTVSDGQRLLSLLSKIPDRKGDINHSIKLTAAPKGCSLGYCEADNGQWQEVPTPEITAKGQPIQIRLNRTFMQKALQFGLCKISLTDQRSPLVFEGDSQKMVVMPLRVD